MRDKLTLKQAAELCGGSVAPEYENISFFGANFDTRRLKKGELFVALAGARDGHAFAGAAMETGAAAVLASRPLPKGVPAIYVENTERALQSLARRWRESLELISVGVTGSVGKTTTKEMLSAVLQTTFRTCKTAENFNNHIGLPVTLLGIDRACQAAVLEMGMNHSGEISLLTRLAQPDIAVITNVGRVHIEHLGSEEGILQAKLEILEGLKPGGTAIFNGDIPRLYEAARQHGALTFGFAPHNDIRGAALRQTEDGLRFTALAFGQSLPICLPVTGEHQASNALAAVAVGLKCGVAPHHIAAGLETFRNTGMRQRQYDLGSYHIIEDCYNAGPESMAAALKVLSGAKGRKIAILGGMLELGDYAPGEHISVGEQAAACAELLFAYGAHSDRYVLGAKRAGCRNAWCFDSHEALFCALQERLLPGDTLLFKGSRGMHMERVLQLLDTAITGGTQHG